MGWDQAVLTAIAAHRTGWLDGLARGAAALGGHPGIYAVALVLCAAFGWFAGAWRAAAAVPLAAACALLAVGVAKDLVDRARPPQALALLSASGTAMPSSVAAMTAAAAVPVVLVGARMAARAGRALVWLPVAGTVAIGLCMVYLGVHWLSDVLVGWAAGAVIGLVVLRVVAGPAWGRAAPRG